MATTPSLSAPHSVATALTGARETLTAVQALQEAATSLAEGSGPAGGAPMNCKTTGGGMSCSAALPAAPSAIPLRNGSSPSSRYGVGLAPYGYGSEGGMMGVLLFGGASSSGGVFSDTWQFNFKPGFHTWTNITGLLGCGTPGTCPSARHDAVMVWDSGDGYILLFGGCGSPTTGWTESTPGCNGSANLRSDTWEYSASLGNPVGSWTKLSPPTSPSARFAAAATYDLSAQSVVLYGGCGSICPLGDTWEFRAGSWTQMSPTASPPALYGEALGYATGLTTPAAILFGGCGSVQPGCGASGPEGSTWEFTTTPTATWTELIAQSNCGGTVVCPPAEFLGGSTTFGAPGASNIYLVLNGGVGTDGEVYGNSTVTGGDWWAFGASGVATWTQYTAPPGFQCVGYSSCKSPWYRPVPPAPLLPRYSEGLAGFNTGGDDIVLFGGSSSSGSSLGDTWQGSMGPVWAPSLPSPRFGATLAYDNSTDSSVLFGGCTYGCPNAETWQFEKNSSWASMTWTSGSPPLGQSNSPSARMNASMAYDPNLGGVILFGGQSTSGSLLNDTWNFTSSGTWELLPVSMSGPLGSQAPPMQSASMAWDPSASTSGRILLYGGLSASGPQDILYDLIESFPNGQPSYKWAFAAGAQSSCSPGPICTMYSPPALYGASMVYDPSFHQIVLFGGCGSGCPVSGMYTLNYLANGTFQWNDCVNCGNQAYPLARWGASMVYDTGANYVLLFGGMGKLGPLGDTWSFTLGAPQTCTVLSVTRSFCAFLTEHNVTLHPSPRWGAVMDFDPNLGGVLLFGGWNSTNGAIPDEYGWEYLGGTWTTASYPGLLSQYGAPPPAFGSRLTYDSSNGFVVEYGGCAPSVVSGTIGSCGPMAGYGGTWLFANGAWTIVSTPTGNPSPRWDEGLAYDSQLNKVILFGGCTALRAICSGNSSYLMGDTWTLSLTGVNLGSWIRVSSGGPGSPSPRADMAMAYDSSDNVVILFGGYGCPGTAGLICNDTWTYGSGGWSLKGTPAAPSPRFGAELAYDPATRGVVLVGGQAPGGGLLNDTWSFNLSSGWVREPSAPYFAYDGGAGFDPVLASLVVFGGIGTGGTPVPETALFGSFGGRTLTWVLAGTNNTPTARWGMGMVYDPSAGPMGYLVMFGGSVSNNSTVPGPGGLSGAWGETWNFYAYLPGGIGVPRGPEYWLNLSEVT